MITVTRLYKNKSKDKAEAAKTKSHSVFIAPAAVAMVRGSTVFKNQKATITLVSGQEIPVTETKKEVLGLLGIKVKAAAKRR